MTIELTAIILVGGRGRRFGADKASAQIGGCSMLQHIVQRLAPACERFLTVTSDEDRPPPPFSSERPHAMLVDARRGELGPLAGIETGLAASQTDLNFVLACDMPLVNADLVRYLAGLAGGYQAVVPWSEGWPMPLHAVYRREAVETARQALDAGERDMRRFLKRLRVRYATEAEMRPLDPELRSLLNVNAPADLEQVRRWLEGS